MFNQNFTMNTDFFPVLGSLASSDSPNSTPWNQQEWQAFNQDPDPINNPETNHAGWRTSLLCPSIHAFLPIDIEPDNIKPDNTNPGSQKGSQQLENIADTTLESQDSTLELTFMTSALSLSEHSTLQSKFDWNFYSNMDSMGT